MDTQVNLGRLSRQTAANVTDQSQALFTSISDVRQAARQRNASVTSQTRYQIASQSGARQAAIFETRMPPNVGVTFDTGNKGDQNKHTVQMRDKNRYQTINMKVEEGLKPRIVQQSQQVTPLQSMNITQHLKSFLNPFGRLQNFRKEKIAAKTDKDDIKVDVVGQNSFDIRDDHLVACFNKHEPAAQKSA